MTTEDYFFTTLKGARGQLSYECELIKGKAYQEAYDKVTEWLTNISGKIGAQPLSISKNSND
ncbi:hypothetical protein HO779_10810 [Streptococcus suis]|nr:hypothetical protein [Streptococcus suis]